MQKKLSVELKFIKIRGKNRFEFGKEYIKLETFTTGKSFKKFSFYKNGMAFFFLIFSKNFVKIFVSCIICFTKVSF